jgi:outer membrane protein TolC
LVCWTGAALHAAEPSRYDLAACIREALENSPDLAAAAAELAKARGQLDEANAGRYGRSSYTQLFGLINEAHGNAVNATASKFDFFHNLGPFTRLELDVDIPVWTFGKLDAALEAAQQGLETARAAGTLKRNEVILNVKQLYYSVLLGRQLSAVLHDMLDSLDKAITKTQQRLDQGAKNITEIDVLKLKIGRAKLAKGVLEVDAASPLAQAALARAIGYREPSGFDIVDQKLEPVRAQLEPLETYLSQSLDSRPEWQQLTSGVAARAAQVKLEEAGYYPTVFFSTGVQYAVTPNRTEQDSPFAYDEYNFLRPIGLLGLRWDLNFKNQQAKVEQARADLVQVQAQQRAAASGLRLEIQRAYSEVTRQHATIETTEQGRKSARGWLILGVANFDLGIGEPEELFKALGAYTESSTDYFRAVHDYNLAVAELGKAVGKELTSLEY